MNALQKRLVIFIFILSLGIFVAMFNVGKIIVEKRKSIGNLSGQVAGLNKKVQGLETNLSEKTKELEQAKNNIEELTYNLSGEKKRAESFQTKYNSEKERGDDLEASLNKLKLTLQDETNKKEQIASELEKVKEERDFLTRDLNEVRLAKQALEEFIGEKKEGNAAGAVTAAPLLTNARVMASYPQGVFAIELEKSPLQARMGKIEKGGREIEISKIHSHMLILEVDEKEGMAGLKKGDVVKYIR